jgi:hypothetical protein
MGRGRERSHLISLLKAVLRSVPTHSCVIKGRLRLKCDGTRAETRFDLSTKRTSPFKSAGASVQSTTVSRGVRISGSNGSNAGYTVFRGSVKGTGYPFHSPDSPSLPLPCVTVCHHISTGLYQNIQSKQNYLFLKKISYIFRLQYSHLQGDYEKRKENL